MNAAPLDLPGFTPWPESFARRYRDRGWWAGETLGEMVDLWESDYGDRVALTEAESSITYRELAARSRRLENALTEHGIRRGDHVVVQLANTTAFCDLTLALVRLGALPVMALPSHREHEIGYLLDHTDAVALAVPGTGKRFDYLAMASALRDEHPALRHLLVDGDSRGLDDALDLTKLLVGDDTGSGAERDDGPLASDVALFLLSGGTTGTPKLIPRTHDDYAYNARASAEACALGPESVYLAMLPVSHNFPLACPGLLGTWSVGGRVVLGSDPSPEAAFALIAREGVTATALVPALALRWMESPAREEHDLSSLSLIQVGGARFAEELAARLEPALDVTLQQVFGMAEGLLNYTSLDDPPEVRFGTQGHPVCVDDEIRIVDEAGDDLPDGEEGELLTRGPYTIRGYYRAPEHNARAFTDDGFYRTGDVVIRDESGNLIVQGRAKDLINRGGEKISAEDVENLVLGHPAVLSVAAVAMPDADLGERTCVYVVLREGQELSLDELCEFLNGRRIARYKLPERLELVDELPLTKVGKVDKAALREDVKTKLGRASA
jgi:2,3-dihydroxybenzoate-AMP ligase